MSDINELHPAIFNLSIDANFMDNGSTIDYSETFEYEVDVPLNQAGFPADVSGELISSSAIAYLDNDGEDEIISSDKVGFIHVLVE